MVGFPKTATLRLGFGVVALLVWILLPEARTAPSPELRWFKGNLHTHTVNSDGDSTPDAVARWYKEHRYNFLVLTDHDFLTEPEGLNSVFAAKDKFLLISGEEVSSRYEQKPIHVNAFQIRKTIPPVFGHSVVETIQKNVDAIRTAGGVPSLNHPNFVWAVTPDDLKQVRDLKLFEVYNGHPRVHNLGGGGQPSLEELWDAALTAGREMYGIAVDDAHYFKVFGPQYSNPGRGWVAVKAPELSEEAVIQALEAGEFYASTGVELEEMTRLDEGLRIKIKQQSDFKYTTRFYGQNGELLHTAFGTKAVYHLRPGDQYARATVTDSGGAVAWAQPVFAR